MDHVATRMDIIDVGITLEHYGCKSMEVAMQRHKSQYWDCGGEKCIVDNHVCERHCHLVQSYIQKINRRVAAVCGTGLCLCAATCRSGNDRISSTTPFKETNGS
eukprot:GHVU01166159.1.p2 GENE.GHVU01166159.1~~GHVU01166159.1.p2  ORF type:complete len:104 (+),score=9.45 GHVU01166159.1:1581-1892(+)